MKIISDRIRNKDILFGIGASLGSGIIAELIGAAGFDWIWIDLEHGTGGLPQLIPQLQAISSYNTAPIIRVPFNEQYLYKQVLDAGASGVMVPFISNRQEAEKAVASLRYPPLGVRGVAKFTRAAGFGKNFDNYFSEANESLALIVQIETYEAVEKVDEIAKVDGVDVLFVGPLDLSVNMGIPQKYDDPSFISALERVAAACRKNNKAAGILVPGLQRLKKILELGFTFLVVGSDGGILSSGLSKINEECNSYMKA